MTAVPREGLVEGCQPLLAVQDQEYRQTVEGRRFLKLPWSEDGSPTLQQQEAAGWEAPDDGDDELSGRARVPNEAPLEVGQRKVSVLDLVKQVGQMLLVCLELNHCSRALPSCSQLDPRRTLCVPGKWLSAPGARRARGDPRLSLGAS